MGLFNFGKAKGPAPGPAAGPDLVREQGQMEDLRELVRHMDEDRALLIGALQKLQPGLSPEELASALFDLCFRPLGLAAFFLALADWEADALHFPLYHEGGRSRPRPWRRLSESPGLTGQTLSQAQPLYVRTLEEGKAFGVVLSEVEKESGLVPQSWYGVPLGAGLAWGTRPFGVVSFQSFQPDAFTGSRRGLMQALGEVLAFAIKADPERPLVGQRP
ncbi:MAG TPA: GAF domain-containing protein [Holophagaceae bacterium]|jgi:hypothetical protein|nr:GAF domain-containing protein [Holophagaceae bacterium]